MKVTTDGVLITELAFKKQRKQTTWIVILLLDNVDFSPKSTKKSHFIIVKVQITTKNKDRYTYAPNTMVATLRKWKYKKKQKHNSVQFSSVAQLCLTLCDPVNCSTPGLPVHHHLLEFMQTHVHQVSDAIQPSHPLSSPSPPAPNPSQHQSLFQ